MFYKGSEDREKRLRFSIRKVSFGAASVAVATLYLFMGSGVVSAAEKDSGDRGVHQVEGPDSRSNSDKIEHSQGDSNKENLDHSDSTNVVKEKASSAEGIEGGATGAVTTSKDTNPVSDRVQDGTDSQEQSVSDTTPSNSLEDKPKKRSRRDLSTSSEQTDDPDANQVFEAPNENENVDGLLAKLVNLSDTINNETKLANIDQVAADKNIAPGTVQELNEFGGWKAVRDLEGQGKFAVARKTSDGVFPIETVNTVKLHEYTNRTWTLESVVDRGNEHVLLLSEVRTEKTKDQAVFDETKYREIGEPLTIARGLKGYNGIEKTFKAYSPTTGSTTKVSFKTGYTGDIDGHKAKYKVEVLGRTTKNSNFTSLYSVTFDPSVGKKDANMQVIAARDGNSQRFDTPRGSTTPDTLNKKLADRLYSPNGRTGTFTSKDIEIPVGYTEYTVRISSADNTHLGMGYQIPWKHYALPIAGLEFSITQDTKKAAKALLTKTYDKLKEQLDDDTKWSTPETKAVYEAKLQKIKDALNSDTSTTASYKTVAEDAVAQQKKLNEEVQIKKKANDAVTAKLTEKEQSIEDNGHLSPTEKSRAKEQAKEEARKANLAITGAGSQTAVTTAQTTGEAEVKKVNPVGKEKAKKAIQDELTKKEAEIEGNDQLSPTEKQEAKEAAKAKAKAQTDVIDQQPANADTPEAAAQAQTAVTTAQTTGEAEVKKVNPVGKEKAKKAIQDELTKKEAEIEGNDQLSPTEKQEAKEAAKAKAKAQTDVIDQQPANADTPEAAAQAQTAVSAALARAIDEINRINPIPSPRHLLTTNNQPGNSGNVNTTEPASPSDSGQANSGQDAPDSDSGSTTTARSSVSPVTTTEPGVNTANRADDTVRSATQGQGTLDKSELSKQTQTLENLLRSLTGVSDPITDSARLVLAEAQKALADDRLTEQGLRHILQTVKAAIASLESIKESQSATKAGEQKVSEEAPEADKSVVQTQISVGAIVVSILVLLGLLFFLLARRNKESELEKLTKELSKLLKNLNLETVDKDVLKKSQEELQNAVSFLADEKGSEHTEEELIENLKEILAKLKANA